MKKSTVLFKMRAGLLTAAAAAMTIGASTAVPAYAAEQTQAESEAVGTETEDKAEETKAAEETKTAAETKAADAQETGTGESAANDGQEETETKAAQTEQEEQETETESEETESESADSEETGDKETTSAQTQLGYDKSADEENSKPQTVTVMMMAAPAANGTDAKGAYTDEAKLEDLDPSIWSPIQVTPVNIPQEQLDQIISAGDSWMALYYCFHDPRDLPRLDYQDPTEYEIVDSAGNVLISGKSFWTHRVTIRNEGMLTIRVTKPAKDFYNKPEVKVFVDFAGVGTDINTENFKGRTARVYVYCDEQYPFADYDISNTTTNSRVIRATEAGWYPVMYYSNRIHVMYLHKNEKVDLDTGKSTVEPEQPTENTVQPAGDTAVQPGNTAVQPVSEVKADPLPIVKTEVTSASPKTGDETPIGMLIALCCGSAAAFCAASSARRKAVRQHSSED